MKIILVSGDEFAALTFENDFGGVSQIKELFADQNVLFEAGNSINLLPYAPVDDTEGYTYDEDTEEDKDEVENEDEELYEGEITVEVFEFGDVDLEFIHFVRNELQDYDDCKHINFYVVH